MMRLIFSKKILLTDQQSLRLHKAFANNSLANKTLSKTHSSKILQSGGFFGELAGSLAEYIFKARIEAAKKIYQ